MRVTRLWLKHFRNHTNTVLECGEGINALLGRNGQGKTNVLEAISYLSLTKSFYAISDATVLQIGSTMFEVEGEMTTDSNLEYTVRVAYTHQGEKVFTINGTKPDTLGSVIGRFPIVILSPENSAISFGSPTERRKFLDLLLSQVSHTYFEDLLEFRRALKQRNKLLADAKAGAFSRADIIEPWTVSVIEHGARVIRQRAAFIREFSPRVQHAYRQLVDRSFDAPGGEMPEPRYCSVEGAATAQTLQEIIRSMEEEFTRRSAEERKRGTTLVGPHRDDVHFLLNGLSMQQFASQGQHKTLLVALKIAEFFYLLERRGERPLMLLDDVFSELDEDRARRLLDTVRTLGQTFITTTDEGVFRGVIPWDGTHRRFTVEAGTVRRCT